MKDLPSYPSVRQSFGIAGIVVLLMILLIPLNLLLNKILSKDASRFFYYLISVGGAFLIVYLIRKDETGAKTFSIEIQNSRIVPLIVVGTLALCIGIVNPINDLIPMPDFVKKAFSEIYQQPGFFSFMVVVVAAPILEELIFRGIMLDGLLKTYTPAKSIFISSFLFGLVHLNPWQFVTGFVIGLFAGWVYYKTHSLAFPILIHFTVNLSAYLIWLFFDTSSSFDSSNTPLSETYGGVGNLLLIIIGSLLVVVVSIYYIDREFRKDNKLLEIEGIEF